MSGPRFSLKLKRMGEGNIFTLCVSPHLDRGGAPNSRSGPGRGVCHPRSRQWGYPIPDLDGGYPIQGLDRWGTPSQVLTRGGTLSQVWMGVPWDTPSPARTGWGTPRPGLDGVTPIRQSSIVSTCCSTGGMPLAFTQEDFLVVR